MNHVRIVSGTGLPVVDDVIAAFEALTDTKILRNRPEIHLHDCPFCKSTDNRGDGVQGAMSYSLEKHCFVCAKCGVVEGWKATFEAFGIEWMVETSYEQLSDEIRNLRSAGPTDRELPPSERKRDFVDHGDYRVEKSVAAVQHAERLMADNSAVRKWLVGRGFSFMGDYATKPEGIWAGESKAGWLVLVYRNRDGSVRGFKYRNIVEKDFFAQSGAQDDFWGIENLSSENTTVTIVEGEIDQKSLEIVAGAKNVLSLPNGGQSATDKFLEKVAHHLEGKNLFFIATDNDRVGDVAATALMQLLPKYVTTLESMRRVRFVNAAGEFVKDANEAVMGGATRDMLRQCFREASDPDLVDVERSEINTDGRFIRTNWATIDDAFGGGLLLGEVSHWAGGPKSGKTTVLTDLHQKLSLQKIRSGFVALDQDSSKLSVRFGMTLLGKSDAEYYRSEGADRTGFEQMFKQALETYHGGRLSLSKAKRIREYADALAAVERMAKSGCKVITVEDYLSLSSMLEKITKGKSVFAGRRIATDLAEIADRCNCHVILVNHFKDDMGGGAYGSGQIGPVVQANVHVSADRDDSGRVKSSILHIKENRFGPVADVDIPLSFTPGTRVLVAGNPKRHVNKKSGGKRSRDDGHNF